MRNLPWNRRWHTGLESMWKPKKNMGGKGRELHSNLHKTHHTFLIVIRVPLILGPVWDGGKIQNSFHHCHSRSNSFITVSITAKINKHLLQFNPKSLTDLNFLLLECYMQLGTSVLDVSTSFVNKTDFFLFFYAFHLFIRKKLEVSFWKIEKIATGILCRGCRGRKSCVAFKKCLRTRPTRQV